MVALPSSPIQIFDSRAVRRNRARSAPHLKEHNFLIDWAARQLLESLKDVTKTFPKALQIGMRASPEFDEKFKEMAGAEEFFQMDCSDALMRDGASLVAEQDFLPIAPGSLDLIIDLFNLHNINDLPGALLQIKQALKPDGLFLAAMLGGETLHELRSVFTETELEMKGGVSPRVHPFADKQDMGALLQRAGFALPVIDSDIVTVTYDNIFKLLADIRGAGGSNVLMERNKKPPGKAFFMEAAKRYAEKFTEEDGRIAASFEVIFLIGWAPHESQQKPLKPGSAKSRLANALGGKEIKAGEKP